MKKLVAFLFSMVVVFTSANPVLAAVNISVPMENMPVYRLYLEANKGEHLYTTDANEASVLTKERGWVYEGVAWFAPTSGTPVYRLRNDVLQNHLYTSDLNEIKVLTTTDVWELDNGGEPMFYSGGTNNIYRLYNTDPAANGLHLLTTDVNEYNTLPAYNWQQEGIACTSVAKGDPLYPITFAGPSISGDANIANTNSQYSIEADVTLSGSGTGYHAKVTANTSTSAVSFGIQYDEYGVSPYTGQTVFLIENVSSNDAGCQEYVRPGYAARNKTFHIMLTVQSDGKCDVYVDGANVGTVNNTGLANAPVYLRVEASARLNGDSVDATFSNIKVKGSGSYNESKLWGTHDFTTNAGISSDASKFSSEKKVNIKGTVTGLSAGEDWDNAYDRVSGIIQFVE